VSAPAASIGLLEREEELGRLGGLMASAAEGRGAAILLEGPAGIGKTSLLEAAVRLAGDTRLGVLQARGGELERDFAYGVVRQLFERRVSEAPERWLEGAASLAAPLVGLEAGERPGDDPTAAALHSLYWLTANLAADGPLLIAIDDLHWVDAASLRFLAYLARRVGELPLLLVAASRPPAEAQAPDVLEALAVERLEPAPLSVAAVGRLVGDELAAACHEATGGNPFLVAAAAEHGELDARNPARSVIRFVSRRLAGLGAEAAALARAVAVLGTDAAPRHAYALAGLQDGAAAEDALVGAGVLAPRRPLEFVHPIVRAAVAEELSPPERARRHLAAARMLDAEGAEAERIAPHLLAADARADPWVVETLRRAAARSVQRGAPEAAVRYLRRALDEPPALSERPALLAETGRAEVRAAMPDDAVEHLREAMAAGPRPDLVADLAIGLIAPGRYEEAVAMLEDSSCEAEPELARRLEAELLCAARLDPATLPVARRLYERLPAEIPDTPGGRMLLAAVAHERVLRGGTATEVRELARRALDGGLIAEQSGDSGLVMDAGFALVMAGDFEGAERAWADALADVRRRGSVIGFARISCMRALLRLRQGRLADAESDARAAIAAAWEPGYRIARMAHGPLVEALVAQGELDAADAALAEAGLDGEIPDGYMLNFVLYARGVLRLAQGCGDADLQELERRLTKWGGGNPAVYPHLEHGVAPARAWGAPGPLGRALRLLGLERGDLGLLAQSVATLDGSPWRLEYGHSLVEFGAALRRAGRRRESREPLYAGMELAHLCGARPLVSRAREELLATGARPRRVIRSGVDALTASERRVARMAAEGMTNREIAQALFVTTRTVEVHLTHAYQKLDIASRDALPAALR
jgi:DNA-binding CsgD family transcriptional regulator/tetratricopeptide (TPR) repeat protein